MVDIFCTRSNFRSACQLQNTGVVLEHTTVDFRLTRKRWEPICFHLPQNLHHGDCIAQQLQQSNVLCLLHGYHDLRLQLDALDDWSAGVQDGLAHPVLFGAWVVVSGTKIPVSTEVGISVHLNSIPGLGVQRDSLRPCGLEVLENVDYCVPERRP